MTAPVELYRVGACFTAASLFEVCIYPSPGLVNPRDNGAHTDMSLLTFLLGSSILSPYFVACVEVGWRETGQSLGEVFGQLRNIGVQAERELLRATSGVNTQRGQLFVLGLAAGITGVCLAKGIKAPSVEFFATIRQACQGMTERELENLTARPSLTAGERLYREGGYTGIRGEAEAGFPTVEQVGYPALQDALGQGASFNDAAVHALINIMACLPDTTILHRAGEEGLALVQSTARAILGAGSVFSELGRALTLSAHSTFCAARLSPGGSADLLALSLALHLLGEGLPTPELLLRPSQFKG